MQAQHLTGYVRIALLAAVAGVMPACTTTPQHYDPEPYYPRHAVYYDYWYYPAVGAYYDPHTHIYIYHEHDHWIRTRTLPVHVRPYIGHYVTVRSPHDRPYEEYHQHWEKYQPERYRVRDRDHHGDAVWIGGPHQQSHQDYRNDRPPERHDHDRSVNDGKPEHGAISFPQRYREADVKYPPRPGETRSMDAPLHAEPPVGAAPIKWDDKRYQPDVRKYESHEQHNSEVRYNNGFNKDHGHSGPGIGQPGQLQAPDSRNQPPPKTPIKPAPAYGAQPIKLAPGYGVQPIKAAPGYGAQPIKAAPGYGAQPIKPAPGYGAQPIKAAPVKQNDKTHQPDNRKEDAQHWYRKGDDRGGDSKNKEVSSPRMQPYPSDKYYQYR